MMFSLLIWHVGSLEVDRYDELGMVLGAELGIYDEKAEVVMGPMRGPYGTHAPLPCDNCRTNLDCCFFACH